MLPPLNQIVENRAAANDLALGPHRDGLQRPIAPTGSASVSPFRSTNAARRVSAAKPPSAATATTFSSPRRTSSYRTASSLVPAATMLRNPRDPQELIPGTKTAIETVSRIPREFFVMETHAVLPQNQYPPTQYQSAFVGAGAWETVVFPALTPHTRQQVLCLRHALETMRAGVVEAASLPLSSIKEATTLAVDYTEKEWALHSICFHELARQIKFICREQSELLFEIQVAYDATVARLATLLRQLQQQHEADQTLIAKRQEEQRAAEEDADQWRQQAMDNRRSKTYSNSVNVCPCGRSERVGASDQWTRRPQHDGDDNEDDDKDRKSDDDDDAAWRAFQRQRRLRIQRFAEDEDGDSEGGGNGRLWRASIVEENTAAARVQQAFAKYQQRKEAHRTLQRQEKSGAVLDIQRSYRGYRERKRAVHHRAVMSTILMRRQQIAAVELLQMNVRAYLIKMRRAEKHKGRGSGSDEQAAADALMVEAEREVAAAAAAASATAVQDTSTLDMLKDDRDATVPSAAEAAAAERFAQLLNGMSELAAAFALLHSRRRYAKVIKHTMITAEAGGKSAVAVAVPLTPTEARALDDGTSGMVNRPLKFEEAEDAAAERELLDATLRSAEDLMLSFRTVIYELRNSDALIDDGLTKATSTTTLPLAGSDSRNGSGTETPRDEAVSQIDPFGSATFLFLDDDVDGFATTALSSPRPHVTEKKDYKNPSDDDDDDSDATHLDDVLWQASVYTPRSRVETKNDDDNSTRQLLLRKLLASRDQQKRYASLKQFIVDIYDTIVGQLRELPRARLHKLVQIHASLALSFADGQRLLRGRRVSTTTTSSTTASEYEPVRAFVGHIDLQTLIHDHFHCHVGLKHLVDAATQRVEEDLVQFRGIDPDVERFHAYLTHDRSLDDLVFFCLCRLLGRDTMSNSRQPVFHSTTLREVVNVTSAMEIATAFFHACGDDASMMETDAFVIEPTNEIYTQHLPSSGLHQLEVLLRDFVSSVDSDSEGDAFSFLHLDQHMRATNSNHFHAPKYNAHAARSPLRQPPASTSSSSSTSVSSSSWMFFTELVDLLRRYRSVTRHFHAFVHWTYELFYDAFREQRQQLLDTTAITAAASGTPLLEEAAFVQMLLPYSLGAGDRELRNVFHNALKQRQLQRFMPVRVFVSVVLVLVRNGLLSITSYQPLQQSVAASRTKPSAIRTAGGSYLGTHRRHREERQWLELALQWRAQEQRFDATVKRLCAAAGGGDHTVAASRLLQWRNELYEHFMQRAGRESLQRAKALSELLLKATARHEGEEEEEEEHERTAFVNVPETEEGGGEESLRNRDYAGAAAAVGSPWVTGDADTHNNEI